MKRGDWLAARPNGINLVLPGAATMIPVLVAVYYVLTRWRIDVAAASGTSSGGIKAAGIAAGMTPEEMLKLGRRLLQKNRLLDRRPFGSVFGGGYALHRGDVLRDELLEALPFRMGDCLIPWACWTVDLEARAPRLWRSDRDAKAILAEVVTAGGSLPGVFAARRIPGYPGLHVDGGVSVNVGSDVWDGNGRPTVTIRLDSSGGSEERTVIRNPIDFVTALGESFMGNISRTHISRRHWPLTCIVPVNGQSKDFDLTNAEIDRRWALGYDALEAWLSADIDAESLERWS